MYAVFCVVAPNAIESRLVQVRLPPVMLDAASVSVAQTITTSNVLADGVNAVMA
jgi:hypothetical protein